jgi:hypothetical protein
MVLHLRLRSLYMPYVRAQEKSRGMSVQTRVERARERASQKRACTCMNACVHAEMRIRIMMIKYVIIIRYFYLVYWFMRYLKL